MIIGIQTAEISMLKKTKQSRFAIYDKFRINLAAKAHLFEV